MSRRKITNKKVDQRIFATTARRTRAVNVRSGYGLRGGIRL